MNPEGRSSTLADSLTQGNQELQGEGVTGVQELQNAEASGLLKKLSGSSGDVRDPFSLKAVPYAQPTTETGRGELQEFRSCRMRKPLGC